MGLVGHGPACRSMVVPIDFDLLPGLGHEPFFVRHTLFNKAPPW